MRRTILAPLAALGLLAGVAAPALAQAPDGAPPPPRGGMRGGMLMRADANGDGVVTRAEATAAADARFDRLDANRDGTVTPDEIRAGGPGMRGGRGDAPPPPPPGNDGAPPAAQGGRPPAPGPMTREAARARALEAFDRADTNHDGRVDGAELAAMRGGPGGPRPGGDGPPPPPQD